MDIPRLPESLREAREAFANRDWVTAHRRFVDARVLQDLAADDLYAYADAAWWLGHLDESIDAFKAAYALYVEQGQPRLAAITALNLAYTLGMLGEPSLGSGWLSRTMRLLKDEGDCVEKCFLDYVEIEIAYGERAYDTVLAKALRLQESGARFKDPNLAALGIMSEGLALIRQGTVRRGLELLDEAMLAAVSDNLGP